MKNLFSRRSRSAAGLGIVVASFMAIASAASAAPLECKTPSYVQPFAFAGDENWYVPVPGESFDSFGGEGWQLSGGAMFVPAPLADGSRGEVLNLPSGSKAVSPVLCVTREYPTARAMVYDLLGSEGVSFYVEYEGTSSWEHARYTGQIRGQHGEWTLSEPVGIQPEAGEGWQGVRITLTAAGRRSDVAVYNLYVDPRMG